MYTCVYVCTCLEYARARVCVFVRVRARTCVCRDSLHASNKYASAQLTRNLRYTGRDSQIHCRHRSRTRPRFRYWENREIPLLLLFLRSLLFYSLSLSSRKWIFMRSRSLPVSRTCSSVRVSLCVDFLVSREVEDRSGRMRRQDANYPREIRRRGRARGWCRANEDKGATSERERRLRRNDRGDPENDDVIIN